MISSGHMIGKPLQDIDTPSLLVRRSILQANINRLQAVADAADIELRPHIKAHKTPQVAQMQIRAGAAGVTAAKIGEAEVMASAGVENIFIANQIVGPVKLRRLVALARRVPVLSVAVDSVECARGISDAFSAVGMSIDVMLEMDAGAGRCGVLPDGLVALADEVAPMPGLNLVGLMSYGALAYQARGLEELAEAAAAEGAFAAEQALNLREAGFEIERVSGGSTPTGLHYKKGCGLTEIRSGTYCLYDHNQVDLGTVTADNVAATVLTQVISVPSDERAICDAGTKALDQQVSPMTEGYGWTRGEPRLSVYKINDEHGYIDISGLTARPKLGDRFEVIPPRICTALNLYDWMYVIDDEGRVADVWRIAARGKNV